MTCGGALGGIKTRDQRIMPLQAPKTPVSCSPSTLSKGLELSHTTWPVHGPIRYPNPHSECWSLGTHTPKNVIIEYKRRKGTAAYHHSKGDKAGSHPETPHRPSNNCLSAHYTATPDLTSHSPKVVVLFRRQYFCKWETYTCKARQYIY